jgi:hypothetical protein
MFMVFPYISSSRRKFFWNLRISIPGKAFVSEKVAQIMWMKVRQAPEQLSSLQAEHQLL